MKKSDFLGRRREILKQLKELKEQEEKLIKELGKITLKCDHEITIRTREKRLPPGSALITHIRPSTYCFFCKEHLEPRKYVPKETLEKLHKSISIDMNEFPEVDKRWAGKQNEMLETLYETITKELPNKDNYQIGKIMRDELEIMQLKLERQNNC